MTRNRLLIAVSPAAVESEWRSVVGALAGAIDALGQADMLAIRTGSSGWVRPADRAPVTAPEYGDTILVAGCGADDATQIGLLEAARIAGARVAVYVHDLTPLRRPEWFAPDHTARFGHWLQTVLSLAQLVIIPSSATGRDLDAFRRRHNIADHGTRKLRLGDGVLPSSSDPSPIQGPYVLLAAPFDQRTGHGVVLSAWRRLGARFAPGTLPRLVLAGGEGHLCGELRERLARGLPDVTAQFGPSPAELAALFAGCRFTILPAPVEGWGLPVTESFALGKPVFAANSGGLPEAGQRLARYFDPLDPDDLARNVERALRDQGDLSRWQAEIARGHQKRGWMDAAMELLGLIAALA